MHVCVHVPAGDEALAATALAMQVWVSDTWKFIYIRQPKSSSSAVIGSITTQLCKGRCRRGDLYAETDMGSLALIWHSYFVFTFVRNPWTRALSAYSMFSRGVLHTYVPTGVDFLFHRSFGFQWRDPIISTQPVKLGYLPRTKNKPHFKSRTCFCQTVMRTPLIWIRT